MDFLLLGLLYVFSFYLGILYYVVNIPISKIRSNDLKICVLSIYVVPHVIAWVMLANARGFGVSFMAILSFGLGMLITPILIKKYIRK